MRRTLCIAAAAAVAALGANIVGEYEFRGFVPFVAGPLFGLVLAEVTVSIARRRGAVEVAVSALASALGLGWGVWISTSEGLEPWPVLGWAAIALAAVAAAARAGRWGALRSAAGGAGRTPSQDRRPTLRS